MEFQSGSGPFQSLLSSTAGDFRGHSVLHFLSRMHVAVASFTEEYMLPGCSQASF